MICFGIWNSIQDTYIYLPRAQSNRLSLRRRRDDLLWHMEFNPRLLRAKLSLEDQIIRANSSHLPLQAN
ncbi:hypothetical protein Syun_011433 [Stephania yunnanensis]|uniref:Uncharacterized protein n=1 Tax=Stephania yunnanensis TaxID=152371 RepID=A0AAP0JXI6_9MAGN